MAGGGTPHQRLPEPVPAIEVGEHDPLTEVHLATCSSITGPSLALWDSRSEEEYAGVHAFAQKAGHIPAPSTTNGPTHGPRNNLRLRPLDDIRAELEARGITPDKK